MLIAMSALKGYAVEASDGGRIGAISDVLFNDVTWTVRWFVVDVGSWLKERKVLIHPSTIMTPDYVSEVFRVTLSKAQIEGSPPIRADQPVSMRMESSLYDYYGSDPLWGYRSFGADALAAPLRLPLDAGTGATETASEGEPPRDHGDPHLRSLDEVTGYHLHAVDGEIGHAENFLLDDGRWDVRYIIADTKNWWPGRHVLMSPAAVRGISWTEGRIRLGVDRETVRSSPAWDPLAMIDQVYEKKLHGHYGWHGTGF